MLQELVFHADARDCRELRSPARLRVAEAVSYGGLRPAANDCSAERDAVARQRLLSASEAVERMGVSETRLREISDFYWELIGMGCRPFGRPPVRVGGECFYATETLDLWFGALA